MLSGEQSAVAAAMMQFLVHSEYVKHLYPFVKRTQHLVGPFDSVVQQFYRELLPDTEGFADNKFELPAAL